MKSARRHVSDPLHGEEQWVPSGISAVAVEAVMYNARQESQKGPARTWDHQDPRRVARAARVERHELPLAGS
jgi:hypothetical protein